MECRLFNDGFRDMTGPTSAIYSRADSEICQPDGSSRGTCRKWFGRCRPEPRGATEGGSPSGETLPSFAPSVSLIPEVSAGPAGQAVLAAAVSSGGQSASVAWSYRGGEGVDSGATCSFSDEAAATTTLSCTDDGTFEATVTVSDGVHDPVTATTRVRVENQAPRAQLEVAPEPWEPHDIGDSQAFQIAATDPEANDTLHCQLTWDDGATETIAVAAGKCASEHGFERAGMYSVQVLVEDDDGGKSERVEQTSRTTANPAHRSTSIASRLRYGSNLGSF